MALEPAVNTGVMTGQNPDAGPIRAIVHLYVNFPLVDRLVSSIARPNTLIVFGFLFGAAAGFALRKTISNFIRGFKTDRKDSNSGQSSNIP